MFAEPIVILALGLVGLFVLMLLWAVSRYKRCPSDRVLVIYGKTGKNQSARCIHGGAAFVWPVIQDYQFLDLTPISIDVDLRSALSKQNIRINVPSRFTVGISTSEGVVMNAANRLLGLPLSNVRDLAQDIIIGQMRLVIAMMDIEEINADRDKFQETVYDHVDIELTKIGLKLINVNVTDIHDESGYIAALGKEAAAKAINDAKQSVAEKDRDGAIGAANAEAEQKIKVSEAVARATEGENLAKVTIANSEAARRSKEAEALKIAISSEKIQSAKALEEAYSAETLAEEARAKREMATREANEIVIAKIEQQKKVIEAEAEAERIRRLARGEADATLAQKRAEAEGLFEVLSKQAEGFDKIVKAAGENSRDAVLLMIADKLPELVKTQVEAIKNIKIDKVTVWEGGGQNEGEGNSTSKFVSGLYKSVPPLSDLFNMAGMDLPDYLGKAQKEAQEIEEVKIIEEK
ncbi:MAG: flotillin family protein [Saprospiraceae bacterium]